MEGDYSSFSGHRQNTFIKSFLSKVALQHRGNVNIPSIPWPSCYVEVNKLVLEVSQLSFVSF